MKNLTYILFFLIAILHFSKMANCQSISVATTSNVANTLKTNGLTYSFTVGGIATGYATIKTLNQQNSNLNQQNNKESKIKVTAYPNPFTSSLKISYPKTDATMPPAVKMINSVGKAFAVEYEKIDDGTIEIFVENLPQGTYIVYLCDTKNTYTVKVVKL